MQQTDLTQEFGSAVEAFSSRHATHLENFSVSKGTVYGGAAVVGFAKIRGCGRYYAPDPSGVPAYIMPVGSRGAGGIVWNDIWDLVAWTPSHPWNVYRRTDLSAVANEDALYDAHLDNSSITVCGNPLEWLQSGATGLCVLDWDAFRVSFYLSHFLQIVAYGDATEQKLMGAYDRRVPKISCIRREEDNAHSTVHLERDTQAH